MAQNGVKTIDLAADVQLDEVLGNRNGSSVRVPVDLFTQALLGSGPLKVALDGLQSSIPTFFDTFALLELDVAMTYATVSVGDIVWAQGLRHKVADPGATDHHMVTAGGVKLYEDGITFTTVARLRSSGLVGEDNYTVTVVENGRTYVWVDDLTIAETAANDVILPSGHSGAGRWFYNPRTELSNGITPLPRLSAKAFDLTASEDYRVLILGDSLTAKYTVNPVEQHLTSWLSDQFARNTNIVLEAANDVPTGAGGALGSLLTQDDDSTVALVGYHYDVASGDTIRVRTGGADPFADSVRVFYVQEPGAGSFTLTLTHQDGSGSGQNTVVTAASGTRQSGFVDLTLAGQVTGGGPNKRLLIDITTSGGAVKILPWTFTFDSTVSGAKMTYNRWGGRGGYTFPNATAFATDKAVIGKQILDMGLDLIIVEYADPLVSGREYIDNLLIYLADNDFWGDILLIGSPPVYEAGVSDDLSADATLINGVLVDNQRLMAGYFKALATIYPNVRTFDCGDVIPSQAYGIDAGLVTDADHVHPQNKGIAAILSALIRSIPTPGIARGWQYFRKIVVKEIRLASKDGADETVVADAPKISATAAGDFEVEWKRNLNFKNWFNGSAEIVGLIDRFGISGGTASTHDLGKSVRWRDVYFDRLLFASGKIIDMTGSGTPESAITAPIGSTFRRTDGGAGTTFYVKESGTGNTGWVVK